MKKLIIFLFISLTLTSMAQQKKVHWIHGLGGASSSWNTFAGKYYRERQISDFTNNSYNTSNGVTSMATYILSQIGSQKETNTIAIAHSMGGAATRHLDVNYNGRFSGVVLFGAPLRGTKGANNLMNGNGANYVSNATYKLSRGPLSGSAFGYLIQTTILGANSEVSKWVGEKAMNSIRSALGLGTSNVTTNDLSWDSPYNQQFYSKTTATPKFILWGNENSPAHIRFAAGFAAPNDSQAEESLVLAYEAAKSYYASKRDYYSSFKWYDPTTYVLREWRQTQWNIGYQYLASESESEWANIVGAGSTQAYTTTYYQYTLNDGYTAYNNCVSAANGDSYRISVCYNTYFKPVSVTSYTWVREPFDGLVNRTSATGGGTSYTANADIRELPNNNHQEMRWSIYSQNELNAAFDGLRADKVSMKIAKR